GDDVNRGVRIGEAVTDDLANDLVGADVVAFGAGLVALESVASLFTVEFEQLEVPLLAEIELLSGLGRTEPFALAFDNHGQAGDHEVARENGEFSSGANNAVGGHVELHGWVLRAQVGLEKRAWRSAPSENTTRPRISLIVYGVFCHYCRRIA